jgi:protein SCO1/2
MTSRVASLGAVAAVAIIAALLVLRPGTEQADPAGPAGGDFVLIDQDSTRFDTATLRGKAVFVFFGYSQCPDVCPTTLSKLSSVAHRLGADRDRMTVVYVSVDPERDTPSVLKADLDNFDLDAVGLTGSKEEIDRVVAQYGAAYEMIPVPESAARYLVNHSTTLYLLDPEGRLARAFPYEATMDELVEAVRSLLTG